MEFNKIQFPDTWNKYSLDDVCSKITSGGTPSRTKPEFYENGIINWVKTKELNNYYIYDTEEKITEEALKKSSAKLLPTNTILLAMYGATVGELGILSKEMACNQACCALITNPKICDYRYLFYLLAFHKEEIINLATGAAQQNISAKIIRGLTFRFPDIDQQKEIADILNTLDKKIELNTQINQTLEQIAQTIFKSWFIDFDPVHAKANALANGQTAEQATQAAMAVISGKNTQELHRLQMANPEQYQQLWEIAEAFPSGFDEEGVPRGWESKPLDEIAIYQNGLALQKFRPESEDEYLPVVKIAQLKQGYADGKEKASVNIKPECIIDNGDVIFSWSGSLVVDIWCGGKAALNQHLFKVTSKNYPKWLYYFYTVHHLAEFQRIAADKAVTMGHIKREHLSLALCVIPNNEFIQKFCFLEDYISQIVNNRLQNVSLIKIRDELLPKLLSGEKKYVCE